MEGKIGSSILVTISGTFLKHPSAERSAMELPIWEPQAFKARRLGMIIKAVRTEKRSKACALGHFNTKRLVGGGETSRDRRNG